jgi:glutamine amidotransferase
MVKPIIGIVSSGYGNVSPIQNILKMNGIPSKLVETMKDLVGCDKLIIPGVGAFDPFLAKLKNLGLDDAILSHSQHQKPLLGICIGAHILGKSSEEGISLGLNILDVSVQKFKKTDQIHVPHMGWNKINVVSNNLIFKEMSENHRFYFVHSYYFVPHKKELILALTNYGYEFPSVIGKNNTIGIQFHPEKSQKHGMQLIKNFALYVD